MANEESLREYKARIQIAIDHLEKNILGELRPGALAGVSGFSPYHFQRIFHAFVGETPGDFVNRIRLEKAASRLINYPSEQIAEVASRTGFTSSSAFAKAFREHFCCSAREWRSGRLSSLLEGKGRKAEAGKGEVVSSGSGFTVDVTEPMKAEIRSMPAFHVAYLSNQDSPHRNIGKSFATLRRWADSKELLTPDTKMIRISPDNPETSAPQKRRYHVCLTVPSDFEMEHEPAFIDIPGSLSAVLRFEGDFGGMEQAYDWIYGNFIPENGYQPADRPSFEIFYPNSDSRDKKLSVEVCVPVEGMEA